MLSSKVIRNMHLGYLGDRLSFFKMLRWKREGARHTARFIGVIWFSSTEDVTSFRKHSSVCRTSRFSSAISMMAARTACKRCSLGTSGIESGFEYVRSLKDPSEYRKLMGWIQMNALCIASGKSILHWYM